MVTCVLFFILSSITKNNILAGIITVGISFLMGIALINLTNYEEEKKKKLKDLHRIEDDLYENKVD